MLSHNANRVADRNPFHLDSHASGAHTQFVMLKHNLRTNTCVNWAGFLPSKSMTWCTRSSNTTNDGWLESLNVSLD